ncbi:MAG TPA: Rv2231c family pyridoxal phosphate-dependent protein CobC [Mycobacteriales bacterium]|jgi:histidinol-phosphate aminotransferase|nr:Rv2231c family pyridoxal phosphate-dependent protein CobC [Mycobacteriales bacterium]
MVDLRHHGDAELSPGLLDLAVNVRPGGPPPWLRAVLGASLDELGAYPDPRAATAAVAARHGRDEDQVLLTAGAAEAFVLLARVLRPAHAVVVHPGFTEPEAALRAAGHQVHRLLLPAPYVLGEVPEQADLVVVGNPTNPTGVLHEDLARLCRPGRTVVVDEAFMDAVPGERGSLAGRADLPGLVVVRSLTKTWALAGLRIGYLLADPALVRRLRDAQPLWAVSTPALAAAQACSTPRARAEAVAAADATARERVRLTRTLGSLGIEVTPGSVAPYLLCRAPGHPYVRERLRELGIAVRRGDTFPGLSAEHWRTAVRDRASSDRLTAALWTMLCAV